MNTTQKIAVMQAAEAGKAIEYRHHGRSNWQAATAPSWNWHEREYRVAPPKPVTVLKHVVLDCDGDLCGRYDNKSEAELKCGALNSGGGFPPYVVGTLTYKTPQA